jgi:hypothetical protein
MSFITGRRIVEPDQPAALVEGQRLARARLGGVCAHLPLSPLKWPGNRKYFRPKTIGTWKRRILEKGAEKVTANVILPTF